MIEVWKPLIGFEGLYDVSDLGNFRSRHRGLRKLVASKGKNGYLTVCLYSGGVRRTRRAHTVVAEVFLGPRPEGAVIDHIDNDKTNNCLANLRYITQRENVCRGGTVTGRYPGVVCRPNGKFIARKSFDGVCRYLGTFDTEYEAHLAYECTSAN